MENLRVVPFVRYDETIDDKGKKHTNVVDNITNEEMKNMSCAPVAYWQDGEEFYVAELPLVYNEGASVRFRLVFVYDNLTIEEQKLFENRTIELPVTKKEVVKVYGEKSKGFSRKRRKDK